MNPFKKPDIARVLEDQTYEAQRALIEATAHTEMARAHLERARASQLYCETRLTTLRAMTKPCHILGAPSPAHLIES